MSSWWQKGEECHHILCNLWDLGDIIRNRMKSQFCTFFLTSVCVYGCVCPPTRCSKNRLVQAVVINISLNLQTWTQPKICSHKFTAGPGGFFGTFVLHVVGQHSRLQSWVSPSQRDTSWSTMLRERQKITHQHFTAFPKRDTCHFYSQPTGQNWSHCPTQQMEGQENIVFHMSEEERKIGNISEKQ